MISCAHKTISQNAYGISAKKHRHIQEYCKIKIQQNIQTLIGFFDIEKSNEANLDQNNSRVIRKENSVNVAYKLVISYQ